jgi:hypothetical protein
MKCPCVVLLMTVFLAPAMALAQGLPIPLALSVNPNPVSGGQPISLAVSGTSPGFAAPADVYVGAVLPSGAVQLFTPAGTQMVSVSNLANWTPLITNLNVSTPATFTNVPVAMFTLPASDPPGGYVFFLAVVLSSFRGHPTLQPGDLLALGTAPLTVAGSTLPTHATYVGSLAATSTRCISGDDDAFTLSGGITINRSGSSLSAAGDLSVTRFGVLFTAHVNLSGTVSPTGQLSGTYTETFAGSNGFGSSGSGTFTGTLTPVTLSFTVSGTDTDISGDTCHINGTFQGKLAP